MAPDLGEAFGRQRELFRLDPEIAGDAAQIVGRGTAAAVEIFVYLLAVQPNVAAELRHRGQKAGGKAEVGGQAGRVGPVGSPQVEIAHLWSINSRIKA